MQMVEWVLLGCVLVLCLSLLIAQAITGVPSMPSNPAENDDIVALFKDAGLAANSVIYELGSGWGTMTLSLARAFPDATIRGIELSPLPYLVSRFRTRHLPHIEITRDNFFSADLRDADAVACYLMMGPMPKLAAFLDRMLKPGTPVVALTFWFRGRQPVATRSTPGLRGAAALYRWDAVSPAEN